MCSVAAHAALRQQYKPQIHIVDHKGGYFSQEHGCAAAWDQAVIAYIPQLDEAPQLELRFAVSCMWHKMSMLSTGCTAKALRLLLAQGVFRFEGSMKSMLLGAEVAAEFSKRSSLHAQQVISMEMMCAQAYLPASALHNVPSCLFTRPDRVLRVCLLKHLLPARQCLLWSFQLEQHMQAKKEICLLPIPWQRILWNIFPTRCACHAVATIQTAHTQPRGLDSQSNGKPKVHHQD